MAALLCGTIWAGLVAYLLSRALRQFRNYRQTTLSPSAELLRPVSVSIIVPARNEADNIAACLAGLAAQIRLTAGSAITVVDDGSQDATGEIVRRQIEQGRPIRLIAAGSLPDGWVGKPHACWRGALSVDGAWLCFVDADVRIDAKLIGAAVDTAEIQHIDMLSLHPFQQLGSFWERLVMPAGLLLLACVKELNTGGEPASSAASANGQLLLIRRDVYFAVGGHAAVAAEICEDRALAMRVERSGFRFQAMNAERLASVRMYRDLNSLWEGLAKNAVEILGSSSITLAASLAGMVFGWAALLLPMMLAVAILPSPSVPDLIGLMLAVSGSAVVIGVELGTARHFRIPALFGLLMPGGFTVAAVLACHSFVLRLGGRVAWKGRTYEFHRKPRAGRF